MATVNRVFRFEVPKGFTNLPNRMLCLKQTLQQRPDHGIIVVDMTTLDEGEKERMIGSFEELMSRHVRFEPLFGA